MAKVMPNHLIWTWEPPKEPHIIYPDHIGSLNTDPCPMSPDPRQVAFFFVMVDLRPELIPASEYYKNPLLSRPNPAVSHLLFILQESWNLSLSFLPLFPWSLGA